MGKLQIRLHDQEDGDIIEWLDAQENKTAAVKAAIRAAMGTGSGTVEDAPPAQIDLGAIRAVVDAALVEALTGLTLGGQADPGTDSQTEQDLKAMF